MQTYFIKDKEYHLHYTIGRMEQLEKILGNAITGVMVSITNGKYPTISELCTLFAYGICPAAGTGCWIWYTVYSNAGTDSGGLRFFIPVRLVEWEYFPTSKEKPDLEAEQFRKSQDFAFFAVQFGYSKADYNALTETERALILKAYENKVVADTNLLAGAVLNAVSNAFRKKGKKPQKLWKKQPKHTNKERQQQLVQQVLEADAAQGTAWVEAIYKANGRKRKKVS